MTDLTQWAIRHSVSLEALRDLSAMLSRTVQTEPPVTRGTTEADVQSRVRVMASERGDVLWRNNLGAGKLENGSHIRWGLCNDSARVNERVKSADLIGIKRVLITPQMVGSVIGQFYSVEVKRPGWRYAGTPREQAQLRWVEAVVAMGGAAEFSVGGLS